LARVNLLLTGADANLAALRLTSPKDDNAVDKYRQVLVLDNDNAQANAGLNNVVERYIALADEASAAGDFDKAGAFLDRAAFVVPDAANLQLARAGLDEAQQQYVLDLKLKAAEAVKLAEIDNKAKETARAEREAKEREERV
jgi:tetratricopeptide (TPR) repeat protein